MTNSDYLVRKIQLEDNEQVQSLIKTVMPEFGATGAGFAIEDLEVKDMFSSYQKKHCCYFVVEKNGIIYGGGGVAPLEGSDGTICELRKMYFKKEIRGMGLGEKLMKLCLQAAKDFGFSKCYLETLQSMDKARKLYVKSGFLPLSSPLGNTGHFSCDSFYLKDLTED